MAVPLHHLWELCHRDADAQGGLRWSMWLG